MKAACFAVVIVATLALAWGGPSPWLLKLEVVGFMLAALLFGFAGFFPVGLLRLREVRGMACFVAGVLAMFIDPRLVISATLIGCGIRSIFLADGNGGRPASTDLARRTTGTDIQ